MGSWATRAALSSQDHSFLCKHQGTNMKTFRNPTPRKQRGSNPLHTTDLPLLTQDHPDEVRRHDDVDLLLLHVLQFELVLQREENLIQFSSVQFSSIQILNKSN